MTTKEIIEDLKKNGGKWANILLEFREQLKIELNTVNNHRDFVSKNYLDTAIPLKKEYYKDEMIISTHKLATLLRVLDMFDKIGKLWDIDFETLYEDYQGGDE